VFRTKEILLVVAETDGLETTLTYGRYEMYINIKIVSENTLFVTTWIALVIVSSDTERTRWNLMHSNNVFRIIIQGNQRTVRLKIKWENEMNQKLSHYSQVLTTCSFVWYTNQLRSLQIELNGTNREAPFNHEWCFFQYIEHARAKEGIQSLSWPGSR